MSSILSEKGTFPVYHKTSQNVPKGGLSVRTSEVCYGYSRQQLDKHKHLCIPLSIHKLRTICIEQVRRLSVVALIFSGCRVGSLSFGLFKMAFGPSLTRSC